MAKGQDVADLVGTGHGREVLEGARGALNLTGTHGDQVAVTEVKAGGAEKGGGGGVFHRDAMKAQNKNKVPRGTVSFMKEEGKTGRDRSKGAARTRIAERKAKRRVEV